MEYVHLVPAGDDVADTDVSVTVGNRIVGRIDGDDYGAHLGVNIAEDVRDARLVELHELRTAAFVKAEIEAFAVKQRKDIVKKRITVGKLNLTPGWNYQQGRLKTFIFLDQLWNLRRLLPGHSRGGSCSQRGEPDYNFRSVGYVLSVPSELYLALEFHILRGGWNAGHQQEA